MAELESVSARKAAILNPTEDDETVQALKRRLFESVDDGAAEQVVAAYRALWQTHREILPSDAISPETMDTFRASYPLHPEVLATLTGKTATVANSQRVRGMLRLLARTVSELWKSQPQDATAIHLHHIDPGFEPIRQEFVTRLVKVFIPQRSPTISPAIVSIGSVVDQAPDLVARIHKHVGSDKRGFRKLRYNLVFAVADEGRLQDMKRSIALALALQELVKPDRSKDMALHQQDKLKEWFHGSAKQANQAIQHCYRHIFYPSKQKLSEDANSLTQPWR